MGAFSYDFSALKNMSRDIKKIGETVRKNESIVVKLAANEYSNDVAALMPYKTGNYRRSRHVEMSEEGGHPIALVGSNFIGAKQREFGGIIRAKKAKYLTFKIDGQWVRVKSVYQPPRSHWRAAWDKYMPKYEQILIGVFNREEWGASAATSESASPDLSTEIP
jgi:hypothetical protein